MSINRSVIALFLAFATGLSTAAWAGADTATAADKPAADKPASSQSSKATSVDTSPDMSGVLLDRIVATVNDNVILLSELDQQTQLIKQRLARSNTALPPDDVLRHQVLEHMITTELQLQVAKNQGIQVSDDTVNQTLARIAQQNGFTLNEMPAKLQAQGIDYNQFREQVRTQLIQQQVRKRDVDDRIMITPAEVDEYLSAQAQQGNGDTQYHIYHILLSLPPDASSETVQKVQAKAEAVDKKLKGGADFAATAVAVSDGQQALEGGDLGWLRGSELPTTFADAVLAMEPGEVSDPIRDASGYHIVKLADERTENHVVVTQTHARHILIQTNLLVGDEEAQKRLEKIRQQLENGASFAKLAKKYSNDPGSAAQGGDLGWINPGQVVPKFQQAMDKLKPDQISQPFKTQFGWHIVEVLGRRKQDQTDEVKRNRAYQAIHQRKLREQLTSWLRKLRDQAYVRIRLDNNGETESAATGD